MEKVLIFGAGNVGATIAHLLLYHPLCPEIYLYDSNTEKLEAQLEDLRDAAPSTKIYAHGNEIPDIVINCTGSALILQSGDRDNELNLAKANAQKITKKLEGFNGIFINVANPCDKVTAIFGNLLQIPKRCIFGTGTALEMARMKVRHDKKFYIIGEHGENNILVGDKSLQKEMNKIRGLVWNIVQQKGNTAYGIANIVYQCVDSILFDKQKEMVLCVCHDDGMFYSDRCYLSGKGIQCIDTPRLTKEQRSKLKQIVRNINVLHN